jgi:2-keto-4-pentenoate hydratase/2-oxohepta-3-ene-1,7-dioic acid hydratase in catechol pathway
VRLVSYAMERGWAPGVVVGERVFDLNAVLTVVRFGRTSAPYASVLEFLTAEGGSLTEISGLIDDFDPESTVAIGDITETRLGPPVLAPSKVLCVGLNYADHVGETGRQLPDFPDIFAKFPSTLIGPFDPIDCGDVSPNLDFEGELAVVMGRPCRRVVEVDALSYVAGVAVLNDISARDLQWRGTQWLPGKAIDGSTPWGPALVTLDDVGDLQELDLETRVNGVTVQKSNTRSMIFPIARIIAYISHFLELSPGDVIATGTPEGIGAKRQPPQWLAPGDTVDVHVRTVGVLRNAVR